MDKKRKEKINMIFLLIIVFAGINYGVFTFVIEPMIFEKLEVEDQIKMNSLVVRQSEENAEYLKNIKREVIKLQINEDIFNERITDELDTIQSTVDWYNYINIKGGTGLTISYDLSDIIKGIEAAKKEQLVADKNQVITDMTDPNYDPYLDPANELYDSAMDPNYQAEGLEVEVLIEGDENQLYRTATIKLSLEMEKDYLNEFLQSFESSVDRYFVVTSMNFDTKENNQSETTDELALDLIEDSTQVEEVTTQVDDQTITLDEEVSQEDLLIDEVTEGVELEVQENISSEDEPKENMVELEIEILTFVKDGTIIEEGMKEYIFYDGLDTYEEVKDLF